jgi:hypothetical protein
MNPERGVTTGSKIMFSLSKTMFSLSSVAFFVNDWSGFLLLLVTLRQEFEQKKQTPPQRIAGIQIDPFRNVWNLEFDFSPRCVISEL